MADVGTTSTRLKTYLFVKGARTNSYGWLRFQKRYQKHKITPRRHKNLNNNISDSWMSLDNVLVPNYPSKILSSLYLSDHNNCNSGVALFSGHRLPILGLVHDSFILGPPVLGPPATDFGSGPPPIHSRATNSRPTNHRFWVWYTTQCPWKTYIEAYTPQASLLREKVKD